MKIRRFFYMLAALAVLAVIGVPQLIAETPLSEEEITIKDVYVYAGGSMGSWTGWPGDDARGGKRDSFLIKLFSGAYVNPYFFVGIYGNLSPGVAYHDLPEASAFMAELGSVFAPRFFISDRMAFVIGAEIAYRYHLSDEARLRIEGLAVNACIQIEYLLSDKLILYFNPGFLAQPWGTDSDTNTWYEGYPPMFYFNFGAAYVIATRK